MAASIFSETEVDPKSSVGLQFYAIPFVNSKRPIVGHYEYALGANRQQPFLHDLLENDFKPAIKSKHRGFAAFRCAAAAQ